MELEREREHLYDESGMHWVANCPKCQRELEVVNGQSETKTESQA